MYVYVEKERGVTPLVQKTLVGVAPLRRCVVYTQASITVREFKKGNGFHLV